jgi:hypothetical protein
MISIRFIPFSLAALSMAVLVACGGNDNIAPPVITSQPANATVAEGGNASFSVTASGDGPLSFAWLNASDSSAITGADSGSLARNAVSLADSGKAFRARVANAGGEVLSDSATLTVNERAWGERFDVAGYARNAATVVDSNGHTHLLSINGDSQSADVQAHVKLKLADSTQANFLALSATLQEADTLTDPTTSIAAAANGSGHVLAVWHRNGLVGAALFTPASNSANGGTWQLLPTRVSSFTTPSARDPAVAAIGNTGFEIVWREQTGANEQYDVMARRYTIAGNVLDSQIHSLESSPQDTQAPRIVADAAGNLLAAWKFNGTGVVINRRLQGSAWSTATAIVEGPTYVLDQLRANAAGRGIVLASNRIGDASFIQLDLAAPNPMVGAGGVNAYGSAADAHVFADGRIHVFGVSVNTSAGNSSRLFQWSFVPATGWSGATPVSEISNHDFIATGWGVLNPYVAGADAQGNLLLAWEERDTASGGLGRVQIRRLQAGLNQWRGITPVAAGSGTDHRLPVAAVAADGSATVVFRNQVSGGFGAANFR